MAGGGNNVERVSGEVAALWQADRKSGVLLNVNVQPEGRRSANTLPTFRRRKPESLLVAAECRLPARCHVFGKEAVEELERGGASPASGGATLFDTCCVECARIPFCCRRHTFITIIMRLHPPS